MIEKIKEFVNKLPTSQKLILGAVAVFALLAVIFMFMYIVEASIKSKKNKKGKNKKDIFANKRVQSNPNPIFADTLSVNQKKVEEPKAISVSEMLANLDKLTNDGDSSAEYKEPEYKEPEYKEPKIFKTDEMSIVEEEPVTNDSDKNYFDEQIVVEHPIETKEENKEEQIFVVHPMESEDTVVNTNTNVTVMEEKHEPIEQNSDVNVDIDIDISDKHTKHNNDIDEDIDIDDKPMGSLINKTRCVKRFDPKHVRVNIVTEDNHLVDGQNNITANVNITAKNNDVISTKRAVNEDKNDSNISNILSSIVADLSELSENEVKNSNNIMKPIIDSSNMESFVEKLIESYIKKSNNAGQELLNNVNEQNNAVASNITNENVAPVVVETKKPIIEETKNIVEEKIEENKETQVTKEESVNMKEYLDELFKNYVSEREIQEKISKLEEENNQLKALQKVEAKEEEKKIQPETQNVEVLKDYMDKIFEKYVSDKEEKTQLNIISTVEQNEKVNENKTIPAQNEIENQDKVKDYVEKLVGELIAKRDSEVIEKKEEQKEPPKEIIEEKEPITIRKIENTVLPIAHKIYAEEVIEETPKTEIVEEEVHEAVDEYEIEEQVNEQVEEQNDEQITEQNYELDDSVQAPLSSLTDYKNRLKSVVQNKDKISKDILKLQKDILKYERIERRKERNQKMLDKRAGELTNLNLVMYSVTDIKNIDDDKKKKQVELTTHIAELKASIQDADEYLESNKEKNKRNISMVEFLTKEEKRYDAEISELKSLIKSINDN